jgi:hypothetical protein
VVHGYVSDNHAHYREEDQKVVKLKSVSRSKMLSLVAVEINQGKTGYRFLMPQDEAGNIPDYSFIEIRGIWLLRGNRWRLLATAYRTVEPNQRRASFKPVAII